MGLKPSDDLCVPLCPSCHTWQHSTSEEKFYANMPEGVETVKKLAKHLYSVTGDNIKAMKAIAEL